MEALSSGPEETQRLAQRLGSLLRPGQVVALFGPLASGKTTFVQGLALGMKVPEEAWIRSPSFTLINEYKGGRCPLIHMDAYRLHSIKEVEEIGVEEYLGGEGVVVIEWAERMEPLLPREHLRVELSHKGHNVRLIVLKPFGREYEEMVEELKKTMEGEITQGKEEKEDAVKG